MHKHVFPSLALNLQIQLIVNFLVFCYLITTPYQKNIIYFYKKSLKMFYCGVTESEFEEKNNIIKKCSELSCFTPEPLGSNSKSFWIQFQDL